MQLQAKQMEFATGSDARRASSLHGKASTHITPRDVASSAISTVESKEFSGEGENWNTWSTVCQAQLSALGWDDTLTADESEQVKLGRSDFVSNAAPPERLRKENQS